MSKKELDRLLVVEKCAGKALPQLEGAQMLGISVICIKEDILALG